MHGGGFIALSSTTMQSQTRRWANILKVPIFSIDYRKPPSFRFPTAVEDCYTVYNFIISHIHNYFNIKPKNIILIGDSAGGNLACSLEALILKNRISPKPKAMLLAYPAVDTRQMYSPSRLNAFHDSILFPTFLLLVQKQYLGYDQKAQFNPLASPILLNQSYIEGKDDPNDDRWPYNWPKTVILVGKKDPLYDDSVRLMERLVQGGVDAKMYAYQDFGHAFLSMRMMISQCD